MLTGRPTEFGTGIEIIGDYWDLKNLYNTVHSLARDEDSPGYGAFMSFAYEIRKANNNQRYSHYDFVEELANYKGCRIFWAHSFAIIKFMRENAGFTFTNSDMQADIYCLESIIEGCLKSFDLRIGEQIFEWLTHHNIPQTEYIEILINRITLKVVQAADGKPRFKQLRKELETFSYDHPEHIEFRKYIEGKAKNLKCKVSELDDETDFSELNFNW